MRKFWSWIRDDGGGRVLRLDGPIDEESLWSDGVTPKAFRDDLYAEDGDVTIFIRSPGGNVFAAAEIYTMIRDYPGFVTVKIDSIAASAASVVAMAGDRVLMSPVAMMMCHDPATIAMGNAHAMEKAISTLNEVKESIINAYQAKTGLSRNKIAKLMSEETWFNARKAVELGFADEIMFGESKAAEKPDEPDGDSGDHESDEEKDDGNGGIHLEAPGMAEALESLLYSTRRMGEAILNSIGALDTGGEGEPRESAECKGIRDGEAAPSEAQPEGEAAPVAEDSAEEEAPVAEEPAKEPAVAPEDTGSGISDTQEHVSHPDAPADALPPGYYAVGIDGRTRDGSVPFDILKKQLERMR